MAHLSRILIYPVKALDGVSVETVHVLPSGALADDRRFAIFDALDQYVNGKRNPRIHLLRSSYNPVTNVLAVSVGADGRSRAFNVFSQRRELEEWLTEFFGFAVTFRENIGAGFPDDTESLGPTVIATSTLREIAGWFGLTLEQARARFRTNLEVEGVPAFWEDHLYGLRGTTVRFSVGDVLFDGINPCQRCVVPSRDALTGKSLPEFAKRFVEKRREYLPEWAESTRFNHYYRVAINTRLADPKPGRSLSTGDQVNVIGTMGVPQIPAAAAASCRWSGRLRVAGVFDATPSVRTFRLASSTNCKLPFTYLPGQYLNVEIRIDGVLHRRCYTIASAPTRSGYCEITVKREGMVSGYLHENMKEGMELDVSGPGGRFTFTGNEASGLVLIGAGVGITPLMSVIRYLTDQKWSGPMDLIYCAKTERDIIFRQELESLSEQFPNLRVTTTLTQERNGHWPGLRGRITADLLRNAVPDLVNRRVHICGPIELAHDMTRMLKVAGVPTDQIRSEAFGGSMAHPSPATAVADAAPVVGMLTFSNSGKSVPAHGDQTLIDTASRVGISIDRGCLAGICGRCKVRLLSGAVTMDVDEALSDCDKKDGYVLACQAKPLGNLAVDA